MATNVPNQNRILASSPVSDSMPHPLDSSLNVDESVAALGFDSAAFSTFFSQHCPIENEKSTFLEK